ncbi:DUF6397 family protein [Streptomyces sp. NPDC088194]|uniref:DUF6397 family protein n=1 Tax=Streptomyces sp. NPDC088194 TaxID=3154931 RepID=UPI0034509E2F
MADGPPPEVPDGPLMTLARARDALGLDYDEFDLAVQIGEVPTVACGSRSWKVRSDEVDRLVAEDGHPLPLLDRIRLVGSAEAAKELGVGRERFVRLARVGHIRPVRWYVNRYHALVWMYLARDLPVLAERCPALLSGPLPEGLRAAVADGEDERARGWRSRRVAQLVRDTYDAWDEAAVWSALLGPELVDSALPDPYERAHLRKLRAALPPGRPGLATPEQIKVISTADHPDEIALALVALADALGRARELRPAPGRAVGAAAELAAEPASWPVPLSATAPLVPRPLPLPDELAAEVGEGADGAERAGVDGAAGPARPDGSGDDGRPGLRGLLRLLGRRNRSADASAGTGGTAGGGVRGGPHSSPTSVTRTTARLSSSEAARSTSAEMPQP